MVSKTINFIIRGIQALLAVILMALLGNIFALSYSNQYTYDGSAREDVRRGTKNASELNMAMFCAVFSLCSVFWLILVVSCLPNREPDNPSWWTTYTVTWIIFTLVPEALNVIFYFSDAIALAAALGAHSCANRVYTLRNGITNNASDTGRRCREAQAVAAFMFFALVMWILSAVLSIEAVMPWEEWPSIAWLVPGRAGVRHTDRRDTDSHADEPAVAAFPNGPANSQDPDLEHGPQTGYLRSSRNRSSRKKAERGGGPAVPANGDVMELDPEDGRRETRNGGPEITEHH